MSTALSSMQALVPRFDTFLDRLTQRAHEVCSEAAAAVNELRSAGDEESIRSAQNLQDGVTLDMDEFAAKAHAAFGQHFGPYQDVDEEAVERLYASLEERLDRWEEHLHSIAEKAFTASDDEQIRAAWEAAVADWQAAADAFHCSQCSAPVAVPELYTQAVYLPCAGCGARTTFTPSSNMVAAKGYADLLAEIESRHALEMAEEAMTDQDIAPGLEYSYQANYMVTKQRKLRDLLPSAAAERRPLLAPEFADWVRIQEIPLEPIGYWQTDLAYVNMLTGLTDLMNECRWAGQDEDAELVIEMVQALARPGCEVVSAMVQGTVTRDFLLQHANAAMTRPSLPMDDHDTL
ncbi:hypothetical protein I6B53_01290 [Schaalia sp. 19OD2882]|uniref:hypothetical protein n=1 Tax=Schaalia sp. 19OD2882 TaxID=2794089 RepID=UPI001C1ECB8E|nr:hypothetical protein [Schaalia sp. 19OD2882]QWW19797.1 hypothetical protein I6B53_01290 [Schaalia sp. 19OD2882]